MSAEHDFSFSAGVFLRASRGEWGGGDVPR